MKNQIEKRIIEEAKYIIENPTTVRNMAKVFTVSKSTIHFDLTYRLSKINHKLFLQVYDIIKIIKMKVILEVEKLQNKNTYLKKINYITYFFMEGYL